MKKQFTLIALALLISATVNAQTKIKDGSVTSTSAPKEGAILDLESSNKALLLPRVSLTNTEIWGLTGTAPTEGGYQIYNTNASIAGTTNHPVLSGGIGVYYWDGTAWIANNVEPWNVLGTTDKATLNTQNIYQEGRVLVGFPSTYAGIAAGATNSVIGQKFNVQDNIGVSRTGAAANMVLFRTGGTFAAPTNSAGLAFPSEMYLGNLLFEGYSDGKRLAGGTPANYGTGRVGVAQVRSVAKNTFATDATSWADLQLMTKGPGPLSTNESIAGNDLATKLTITPHGNIGIGNIAAYKQPQNKLVVQGPTNPTDGMPITTEVNRSGVRLDNIKSASYLGTNSDGDIIRVAVPSTQTRSILRFNSNYTMTVNDEILVFDQAPATATLVFTNIYPIGKSLHVINRSAHDLMITNQNAPAAGQNPFNSDNPYSIQPNNSAEFIHLGIGQWIRINAY